VRWSDIASLATAAGTLVLAVATFASVRSANRAARAAEQSLLVGLRPLLVPSRLQDPAQKVMFVEGKWVRVLGGGATAEAAKNGVVYLVASLRNAGQGIGVVHGWRLYPDFDPARPRPALSEFRHQTRDLYVPPGDIGFWQGALRDPADPGHQQSWQAARDGSPVTIDLLYGDLDGGQRVITRFGLRHREQGTDDDHNTWLLSAARHWNVDGPDPREVDD
jgi:hypothetical protein